MKYSQFEIGKTFKTKSYKFSRQGIINYAKIYDPQFLHLDEEKAKSGRFGDIIASGMQTMSTTFKLWIEVGAHEEDVIAGTGMNNIKFIRPVYPEDEINVLVEVIGKVQKKKESGIVTVRLTTLNQRSEKVFEGDLSVLMNDL